VVGYFTLSWTPVALLSIAVLSQKAFGFTRFSEVTYHVGYDTSYLLLMVGILMLLHAVVTHTAKALLILGSCLSAVPILSLTISDRIYG
jgi:predicted tellurium resistance membrane protein TerC